MSRPPAVGDAHIWCELHVCARGDFVSFKGARGLACSLAFGRDSRLKLCTGCSVSSWSRHSLNSVAAASTKFLSLLLVNDFWLDFDLTATSKISSILALTELASLPSRSHPSWQDICQETGRADPDNLEWWEDLAVWRDGARHHGRLVHPQESCRGVASEIAVANKAHQTDTRSWRGDTSLCLSPLKFSISSTERASPTYRRPEADSQLSTNGDTRETSFLFLSLSAMIHRFKKVTSPFRAPCQGLQKITSSVSGSKNRPNLNDDDE